MNLRSIICRHRSIAETIETYERGTIKVDKTVTRICNDCGKNLLRLESLATRRTSN